MKQYLTRLLQNDTLTQEETCQIMHNITENKYEDAQVASLITCIQMRGISPEELLGFRQGLLETGKYMDFSEYNTIDIVGTGGDGKNTFNISTCASFVVAGAGYKVTKHGNGASSSVSGASNVLTAHNVKFTDDISVLKHSLDEAGICYFHAPLFAYGMKNVGPVRRSLAVPTFFNLLGPLVNPCHPKNSLHGTANHQQLRLYNDVHRLMGDNFGVLTSYDGYDEISLTSDFKICTNQEETVYSPQDLGFAVVKQEEIRGGDTAEDAVRIFDAVLKGTSTEAQKNVVIANAAAAISVMEKKSLIDCLAIAKESLESGKALKSFTKFVEING